jgi:nucleoid-associated protein YgaU
MGQNAIETANTWRGREWAARLAAQAGPRDYRGQLEAMYNGILERWRYVMEPGEWIAGTPRTLLGNVLGVSYRGVRDPTSMVDRERPVTPQTRGWGDCDDVASLVASGALSLGMHPMFRVAKKGDVAHVSCIVKTPDNQMISVDPVGHPTYPFGWAMPGDTVSLFTLSGNPAPALRPAIGLGSMMNCTNCASLPTLYAGIENNFAPHGQTMRGHWCAVRRGDRHGPRVLAMPERYHTQFMRGIVTDGAPAVDQHGMGYKYDIMRDTFIEDGLAAATAKTPMGAGFFKRMAGRWKKRIAGVRKLVNRIAKPLRWLQSKLMMNPMVQNVVGAALMSVGIPRAATKAVLQASGEIIKAGGIPALIRMIRKDPKKALAMVAGAVKHGLSRAAHVFSGIEDVDQYQVSQSGGSFYGQPVMALVGVPYIADFGELDVASSPVPGSWYRVKHGDSLLSIAGRAYGVPTGKPRLERAKWINSSVANATKVDPTAKDNLFKSGKVSMSAHWAAGNQDAADGKKGKSYAVLWIPNTAGDEPSAKLPTGEPPIRVPEHPVVTHEQDTPAIGQWYQVKHGDTLLGVAGKLYGVSAGKARLERAKWINDSSANAFAFNPTLKDNLITRGKLAFAPHFGPARKSYPTIWVPGQKGDLPTSGGETLPPEDPKIPTHPTHPTNPSDKLTKFKIACAKTPNGHYVNGKTGPACMVCHPENGEVWDAKRQVCKVKGTLPNFPPKQLPNIPTNIPTDIPTQLPNIPTDDLPDQRAADCRVKGGIWDVPNQICRGGGVTTPSSKELACQVSGGVWDPVRQRCLAVDVDTQTPDTPPGDQQDKKGSMLPLVAAAALLLLGGR